MRREKIERVISERWAGLAVVMEEVKNSHNISAVLRTADASGIQKVYIIDPLFESLRVNDAISTGAEKWITIETYYSPKLCFKALRERGFRIVATSLREDAISIYNYDFKRKVAIVFGNEKNGIRKSTLRMADDLIKIPMRGMVQSLNISVSVGIIAFEALRQRIESGYRDPLPREEIERLIKELE